MSFGFSVVALAKEDVNGKNVISGATLIVRDLSDNLITIYDDAALTSGSTGKTLDENGTYSGFVELDQSYKVSINGVENYMYIGVGGDGVGEAPNDEDQYTRGQEGWNVLDYEEINTHGNVIFKTPVQSSDTHALIASTDGGATRIHQEPSGFVDDGTTAKYDWMFDPYDTDPVNYRISSVYNYVGDPNGTGEPAVVVWNAKSVGNHWGTWPSHHFGFQDDGATGVPMKLMLFDTAQPQFYTPHRGGWREGKDFTTGDYITASNKIYVAVSDGTSGATVPSHLAGTVTDGGVDWAFVYRPLSSTVRPCVIFGDRDDMPDLGHPDVRVQFTRDALINYGASLLLADAAGEALGGFSADVSNFFKIETAGGGYTRYHKSENFVQDVGLAKCHVSDAYDSGETTIDVSGTTVISIGNTTATTITQFTNGGPYQRITVLSSNGNTTLQHNANTRFAGGVNKTLDADSGIDLMASSDGTVFKQIG